VIHPRSFTFIGSYMTDLIQCHQLSWRLVAKKIPTESGPLCIGFLNPFSPPLCPLLKETTTAQRLIAVRYNLSKVKKRKSSKLDLLEEAEIYHHSNKMHYQDPSRTHTLSYCRFIRKSEHFTVSAKKMLLRRVFHSYTEGSGEIRSRSSPL
jgi:hypothetical protein